MKNLLSVLILFTVVQAFSQAGFSESYKKSDSTLYATKYQLDTAKQAMRSEMGGGSNFANANLTFTGNRTHNGNGNSLTLNNMSSLSLGYGSTGPGLLRFFEDSDNGSHYVGLRPQASVTSSYTITLPGAPPASNSFPLIGASGSMSFTPVSTLSVPNVLYVSTTNTIGNTSALAFPTGDNVLSWTNQSPYFSLDIGLDTISSVTVSTSRQGSTAPGIGLGAGISFRHETSSPSIFTYSGGIYTRIKTTGNLMSQEPEMVFKVREVGVSVPTDVLTISSTGQLKLNKYTGSLTGTFNKFLFLTSNLELIESATLPLVVDKTITAGSTTGNQTINKYAGSVNFAAAATSLTVTNSLVTTSSVIICTIATNDATMTSVQAVAASGSFVIYANAAATAETRVNFLVIN